MKTEYIKLSLIETDPDQPRKLFNPSKIKTLKDSIEKYGIMTPLVVEKHGTKFKLVDGERRYRASIELGLKEVPITELKTSSETDKLIQQFHLQEQHEGWSATEKAQALFKLSEELNINVTELANVVGVSNTQLRTYMAFNEMIDQKKFIESSLPLQWADAIKGVKLVAHKISVHQLGKELLRSDEKAIEHAIIKAVLSGGIKNMKDTAKIKDSFKANPKSIEEFLTSGKDFTAESMFVKSNAQEAWLLRNLSSTASQAASYGGRYLRLNGKLRPSKSDWTNIRSAKKVLVELCDSAGLDE